MVWQHGHAVAVEKTYQLPSFSMVKRTVSLYFLNLWPTYIPAFLDPNAPFLAFSALLEIVTKNYIYGNDLYVCILEQKGKIIFIYNASYLFFLKYSCYFKYGNGLPLTFHKHFKTIIMEEKIRYNF